MLLCLSFLCTDGGGLGAGAAFQMLWGLQGVLEILAGKFLSPGRPSLDVAPRTS